MPARCSTCPFGENGDKQIEQNVTEYLVNLDGSQICHHPELKGNPPTHICRGARDWQLRLLHALGMLREPTDEEFKRRSDEAYANR